MSEVSFSIIREEGYTASNYEGSKGPPAEIAPWVWEHLGHPSRLVVTIKRGDA